MTVTVVQLGARMHYAVPRILHAAGLLEELITDVCATAGWPRHLRLVPPPLRPGAVRKILGRRADGVPPVRIASFPGVGLRYARWLRAARTPAAEADAHLSAGRDLAAAAVARGFGRAAAVYAYNSAAVDVFRAAKAAGLTTIYEQTIAPTLIDRDLALGEQERWPGWEPPADADAFYQRFADVEREEWGLADHVVCGSEFVRAGIAKLGGPAERAVVIPYGTDPVGDTGPPRAAPTGRPLRVLSVGTVCLRKGAPYVAAAARELAGLAEFRWVGPVRLTSTGAAEMVRHVHLTGQVPRPEMAAHYRWADAFVLPSVCEGSATVTYEALGYGLPVVATSNTGCPAGDGGGATLVPVGDSAAVAAGVARLATDPDRYARAAAAAAAAAARLTVAAYSDRLLGHVSRWLGKP